MQHYSRQRDFGVTCGDDVSDSNFECWLRCIGSVLFALIVVLAGMCAGVALAAGEVSCP